MSRIIGR